MIALLLCLALLFLALPGRVVPVKLVLRVAQRQCLPKICFGWRSRPRCCSSGGLSSAFIAIAGNSKFSKWRRTT